MQIPALALLTLALSGTSYAFVAAYYSDDACQNQIGQRNVYDNTCAEFDDTTFGSFMITTFGSSGQYARAYGEDSCANFGGTGTIVCVGAGAPDGGLNYCANATAPGSTSHALGSSAGAC